MKRCVVTGLGCVCSIGNNSFEVFENMIKGKNGIKDLKNIDTSNCYTKIGAEVDDYEFTLEVNKELLEKMDRTSLMCLNAVDEALKDSNLNINEKNRNKIGISIGSCTGGAVSAEKLLRDTLEGKPCLSKNVIKIPINSLGTNVAAYLGTNGIVTNIGNACAASTIGIGYACDLIKRDVVDVMVVGGSDALANLQFSGFHSLKALDKNSCSPFSRSEGLSLGEGSGILIIESLEHALSRNAKIYCEVTGYGVTSDAHHITAPNPSGEQQIKAMNSALDMAGLKSTDIGYVNAHGTGTPLNDLIEKSSYDKLFAGNRNSVNISSTKSMVGHCLGASGVIEAIASIKALNEGVIPPTINYEESVQNTLNYIPNKAINKSVDNVMSNSLAFGGNNSSVIFSKLRETNNVENENVNDTKVYITGIGLINSAGKGKQEYIDTIKKGEKNVKKYTHKAEDVCLFKADIENPAKYGISSKTLRKLDRLSKLLLISGVDALEDGNLTVEEINDIGLLVGTSDGPTSAIKDFLDIMISSGVHDSSPFVFPNTVYNAAAGYLSIFSRLKGYTATLVNGISSGISSLSYAFDLIKLNRTDKVIASGVDELSDTAVTLYDAFNFINKKDEFNPYSFKNKGFTLGEGAASIIVESEDSVQKRNGKKYAEILGYGFCSEPEVPGVIDLKGNGLEEAIIEAVTRANLTLNDIDVIVGFGNGDKDIDTMEINSYKRLFKDNFNNISIISIKDYIGEARAAASSMQIAHGALILDGEYDLIENNSNYQLTDKKGIKNVLITSYTYCSSFSAVVLGKA